MGRICDIASLFIQGVFKLQLFLTASIKTQKMNKLATCSSVNFEHPHVQGLIFHVMYKGE